MRDVKLTLITKYKDGKDIKTHTCEVWARKKSVTRQEFYAAYTSNLRPMCVFDIVPSEYHNGDVEIEGVTYHADRVFFEGREHNIMRTFCRNRSSMELTI